MNTAPRFPRIDEAPQVDRTPNTADLFLAKIASDARASDTADTTHLGASTEGVSYQLVRGKTAYSSEVTPDETSIEMRLKKYDIVEPAEGESTLIGDITFRDTASPNVDKFRIRHDVDGEYRLYRVLSRPYKSRSHGLALLAVKTPTIEVPASEHDIVLINRYLRNFAPHNKAA